MNSLIDAIQSPELIWLIVALGLTYLILEFGLDLVKEWFKLKYLDKWNRKERRKTKDYDVEE